MHINAVCPACKRRYQLEPALLGQTIRCPNPACRRPFVVGTSAEAGQPIPESAPQAGSVGELVPILPAVVDAPHGGDTPSAPVVASWQEPPPVRQAAAAARPEPAPPQAEPAREAVIRKPLRPRRPRPAETPPAGTRNPTMTVPVFTASAEQESTGPRELPPGAWEPPPVRRSEPATQGAPQPAPVRKRPIPPASAPRGRWILFAVLGFCLLAAVGLGGVVLVVSATLRQIEPKISAAAEKALADGDFEDAAAGFRQLQQRFPRSPKLPQYVAGQQYAELCARLKQAPNAAAALNELDGYVREHVDDPAAAGYLPKVSQQVTQRIAEFRKDNVPAQGRGSLAVAEQAEGLVNALTNVVGGLDAEQLAQAANDLKQVRAAVDLWQQHADALARLDTFQPIWPAIQSARQFVRDMDRKFPGFAAETAGKLRALEARQAEQGVAALSDQAAGTSLPQEEARSLLFVSKSNRRVGLWEDRHVQPFLANGVLYGLSRKDGAPVWARRVGLDTAVLPVRLPGGEGPDRLLVWSADTRTLTCLDEDGSTEHWNYPLGQPLVGKPLVVDTHVYLARLDGEVHVLTVDKGEFQCRVLLGQRLTVGGVVEPGTGHLWFAADEACIYVLDVSQPDKPVCKQVVETGHAAGSLHTEPFFLPATPGYPDGMLALLVAAPVADTSSTGERLRFFSLPVTERRAKEIPLSAAQDLVGWSWTAPYHQDGERVVIPTDAGRLYPFALKQPGNTNDPLLFPLDTGLDLAALLGPAPVPTGRSRAQVVHVRGDTFWVFASGRLQRLEQGWTAAEGPKLVPGWPDSLALGALKHEATAARDDDGERSLLVGIAALQADLAMHDRLGAARQAWGLNRTHPQLAFYLTTQDPTGSGCLASAVAEDGTLRWQRRLGLVVEGQPLRTAAGDASLVLVARKDGGLVAFDPQAPLPAAAGLVPATPARLAGGVETPAAQPLLLSGTEYLHTPPRSGADGLACQVVPLGAKRLQVRRITWTEGGRAVALKGDGVLTLTGTLRGTPALVGSNLVLPLDNGVLVRVPLARDPAEWKEAEQKDKQGPSWRTSSSASARGYVTAVDGDRFLVTDGLGKIVYRTWEGVLGEHLLDKERRIAGPALLLPRNAAAGNDPLRALVTDTAGGLTLVTLTPDGQKKLPGTPINLRHRGAITAGPFLSSAPGAPLRVGCILDGHTLLVFDPLHPQTTRVTWTPQDEHNDPVDFVGPPQLVHGWLIAADKEGRIWARHASTLEPIGSYRLKGSVQPTATPVAFGADQLFVPLSDATVLLLPLERVTR